MKAVPKMILVLSLFLAWSWLWAQDGLVGHWTFDDPNDLTKATTGNNLILIGGHQQVDGPESGNGAVNIGVGSYYISAHGIDASGGGTKVNEFTLIVDIKIPQLSRWYCMYQSKQSNSNDGEWFINPSGMIGVGATGYTHSLVEPNEWYRLAVSVKNVHRYDYYVDGQLALVGSPGSVDGRFSLGITALLFADENREDNPLDVAEIKMFSRALTNEEIASLGGYGHSIIDEPTTSFHTYLQSPTPTSIYICWHDFYNTTSHIEYGSTEALGKSLSGTVHKFNDYYLWYWAKLTELQPETIYYYKIVTDTMETKIKRFKTQPNNAAEKGHVRFTVIGDNRTDINRFAWIIEKMKEKMTELYGNTDYVQNLIIPTLKKYSKVDLLMYGHSHNYERGAVQDSNLRLLLSGGGGSALDRWGMYGNQTNYPEIQRSFDHYCYILFDVDIENKKYTATTYSMGHLDKLLDNVKIDQFTRDKADQTPRNSPLLTAPDSGARVDFPITLQASAFSGKGEIMSSHFQLSTSQGNYTGALVNSIRDFEDVYFDTGRPNYLPIDLNEGIDLTAYALNNINLEVGKYYWWRVSYRDKNLKWSDWSEESAFTFGTPSHVVNESGINIKANRLYANYPNPFNSSSTIRFDLEKQENVKLSIYDIRGKLIKELINRTISAGEHSIIWNSKDLYGKFVPSGVYYYQIKTNNFIDIGKAILLK